MAEIFKQFGKHKYSFQWKLLLWVLTPLLLTLGITQLILWTTLVKTNKEAQDTWLDEMKNKVEQNIEDSKQEIENLSRVNEIALKSGGINYKNQPKLATQFWYEINLNSSVTNLYFASNEGDYIGLTRGKNNQFVLQYIEANKYKLIEYELNEYGKKIGEPTVIKNNVDPRKRKWYLEAKDSGKSGWTRTYNFLTPPGATGITFAQPVKNQENNNLEGVIGVDFALSSIQNYLSDIDPTHGQSKSLLIDCYSDNNSSQNAKMIVQPIPQEDNNLKDKILIDNIIQKVEESYPCQTKTDQTKYFKVYNYDVYILQLNKVVSEEIWLLVLAIPDEYFTKYYSRSVFYTLFIGVFLTVITGVFAILMSRNVSKPINIITKAANAIELGKFHFFDITSLEKIAHKNDELGVLAKVFLEMATEVDIREHSLQEKLQKLQETTNQRQRTALLTQITAKEYLNQLLKKAKKVRK